MLPKKGAFAPCGVSSHMQIKRISNEWQMSFEVFAFFGLKVRSPVLRRESIWETSVIIIRTRLSSLTDGLRTFFEPVGLGPRRDHIT